MKRTTQAACFTFLVVLAGTLIPSAEAISDSPTPKRYVCPPCSVDCHDVVYDKPGRCPKCNMTLIEQDSLRNVAIVVWDGVELLDFAGPGEVFAAARVGDAPAFRVFTVGLSSAPITSQGFLTVTPNYTIENCPQPSVLIIPGGGTSPLTENEPFLKWVKKTSNNTDMILTVCTGAFVLAETGLLDDIEATTWHGAIESLRRSAPDTKVHADRRFVDNGDIITAAGVSAGIDGALYALSRVAGPDIAAKTARYMEYDYWPDAKGHTNTAELRRRIKENPDAVIAMLEAKLRAGILQGPALLHDPGYFPLHENRAFRELVQRFCHESEITMVTDDEPGQSLVVSGRVVDEDGNPVRRALIYAFHTDHLGNYSSSGGNVGSMGDSLNPRIFGYIRTAEDGTYRFKTIHPGQYPDDGPPAHIHYEVTADGYKKLVTEMMFEGDSRMTSRNRRSFEQAGFIICEPQKNDEGVKTCECNFVIRKG